MDNLIEAIRAASADGATEQQKATAAAACRAFLVAFEAETGKAMAVPRADAESAGGDRSRPGARSPDRPADGGAAAAGSGRRATQGQGGPVRLREARHERGEAEVSASIVDVQAGNFVDLWLELKRRSVALRGSSPGPNGKAVPRTRNEDVLLLATRWSVELAKIKGNDASDRSERQRWRAALAEVERLADEHKPNEVYPANAAFWDASNRLAIYLESLKLRPGRWQLAGEAVAEAVQDLPTALAHAGTATAGAVGRFLSDPIKLGAVVLGSVVLLPALLSRR